MNTDVHFFKKKRKELLLKKKVNFEKILCHIQRQYSKGTKKRRRTVGAPGEEQ